MLLRPRHPLFVLMALASCLAAQAAPSPSSSSKHGGVAYRWVDEQGVVHYGDAVPPQYASQDRAVLNGDGIEVSHLDAQKTPEQAAAAEHARLNALRQRQHDSFLVSTYTSVKDIESLRDLRLEQLQGQRAASAQYIDTLRARLGTLQMRTLNCAPYAANGRRMPDDLAENLIRTLNEVRQQSAALVQTNVQEKELRQQFDADIERYKELHTIHSQ
ncbi:MAG: DUF4124 domain-containing protein [Proteobacteria bacterium]|nr:DUF4124 domain-containing protein [Pseudomonadota bacterium]